MKVWIIKGITYYEGYDILGVYVSKRRAEVELEVIKEGACYHYDSYEIVPYNVLP